MKTVKNFSDDTAGQRKTQEGEGNSICSIFIKENKTQIYIYIISHWILYARNSELGHKPEKRLFRNDIFVIMLYNIVPKNADLKQNALIV